MSDIVLVALIATITPLAGLIVSWINGQRAIKAAILAATVAREASAAAAAAKLAAEEASMAAAKTANKLDGVHQQINGKMEQLLKATGAEERAIGEAEGRSKSITERQDRVIEADANNETLGNESD